MKALCVLVSFFLLPLVVLAAERSLKVDPSRSFVDVDVDATINFTARLDAYEARVTVDDNVRIKTAVFTFKFNDLKTGRPERDERMIEWLGGGEPTGRFELGNLALAPDGQGQASGRLTFHGVTQRVEFPINVVREGAALVVTGETTIDHREWKLKVIRQAMLFKVAPKVKIRFKLTGTPVDEPKK